MQEKGQVACNLRVMVRIKGASVVRVEEHGFVKPVAHS
jgi:hypothetical protein